MFYKKNQQKINGLWYPKSITWGKAITTDQVADQLAYLSTTTRGDAYAIVKNLGKVLSLYMAQGRTVKIDGVGTFYYTAAANKKGVIRLLLIRREYKLLRRSVPLRSWACASVSFPRLNAM